MAGVQQGKEAGMGFPRADDVQRDRVRIELGAGQHMRRQTNQIGRVPGVRVLDMAHGC